MKKYLFGLFLIVAVSLTSCGANQNNKSTTKQDTEHSEDDGHDHGADDGHGHEAEKVEESHEGEIIFSKDQAKTAGVEIYLAELGVFTNVIKTSGQIEAAQGDETTIVATSNGIVSFTSQSIIAGARIAKGATIVTISAKNLSDGDPVAKIKATYQTALKEYNRAKDLATDRIISAKEFEQVNLRYENAKTAYKALADNVTAKGVGVTSPISGYITNRMVNNGDYVSIGQVIATVSQNKKLQLRAEVSQSYFNELKSVRSANFITPYNNSVYKLADLKGRLLSFGKVSEKNSFYIPITFEFDNVGTIIPGSFVEIYLLSTPIDNVISIPVSSLTEEQGVYFIYLQIGDEEYKKQEVKLGLNNGDKVQIISGLSDGDKIVSKGAYQVKLAASSSIIPEGHSH